MNRLAPGLGQSAARSLDWFKYLNHTEYMKFNYLNNV